jgi:hypothetical protein
MIESITHSDIFGGEQPGREPFEVDPSAFLTVRGLRGDDDRYSQRPRKIVARSVNYITQGLGVRTFPTDATVNVGGYDITQNDQYGTLGFNRVDFTALYSDFLNSKVFLGPDVEGVAQSGKFTKLWEVLLNDDNEIIYRPQDGTYSNANALFTAPVVADSLSMAFDSSGDRFVSKSADGTITVAWDAGSQAFTGKNGLLVSNHNLVTDSDDEDVICYYTKGNFTVFARFQRDDFATEYTIATILDTVEYVFDASIGDDYRLYLCVGTNLGVRCASVLSSPAYGVIAGATDSFAVSVASVPSAGNYALTEDLVDSLTDVEKDFEAITGEIPVSYYSKVTLLPTSNCQATLTMTIFLDYDPADGSPSDAQKSLYITVVQSGVASGADTTGFFIDPPDWTSAGTGLLVASKTFPIYFLPSSEDEQVLAEFLNVDPYAGHPLYAGLESFNLYFLAKRYVGYGIHPTLKLTSVSFPGAQPGQYNGGGFFLKGTNTPFFGANPGGARHLAVNHRAAFQAGGTLENWTYNPASFGTPGELDLCGFGYNWVSSPLLTFLFLPWSDCSQIAPANWGVFISSAYFDSYAAEVPGHGLEDIGATGKKGYET